MKLGSILLVVLLASGASAGAQSLGDAAQKEKEKRAKAKEGSAQNGKKDGKAAEAKVYTADDLAGYAPKEAAPSETEGGDVAEGAPPRSSGDDGAPRIQGASEEPRAGESDDSAARAREERAWRQRAQTSRAAIAAAERELAAAEKAKAALGIGPQVDDEMLRRAYTDRVRAADQRVAQAKGALTTARTNQANLEEDARRSGALPGWLR